jgi:hypothetical protein
MKAIAIAFFFLYACAPRLVSIDLGIDVGRTPVSTVGISYPVGPTYVSTGVWTTIDGVIGPYLSVGGSWSPFK